MAWLARDDPGVEAPTGERAFLAGAFALDHVRVGRSRTPQQVEQAVDVEVAGVTGCDAVLWDVGAAGRERLDVVDNEAQRLRPVVAVNLAGHAGPILVAVLRPTTPSAARPWRCCHAVTCRAVSGPYLPSCARP